MKTVLLAGGVPDTQSIKGFYDRRKTLGPVTKAVHDVMDTPVFDDGRRALLKSAQGKRRLKHDTMPLPHPDDRESYYGDRHLEYWLSGLEDALNVQKNYKGKAGKKSRYLDFGGCSGRVARHFVGEKLWEPWVCDINVNYIDWIATHAPGIRALQNRPMPHLPFADGYFDVVSAFSVFTHLDNDEIPWLLELRRVVRKGGTLFLTVIDEHCWELSKQQEWIAASIGHGGNAEVFKEYLRGDIPSDRFVLRYHDGDAYNVNIFFKREYVASQWGKYFSRIKIVPGLHGHQTAVILSA